MFCFLPRPTWNALTTSASPTVASPLSQRCSRPWHQSATAAPEAQIARELGAELGLDRYWQWDSVEELAEATIAKYNEEPIDGPVDWDTLVTNGFVILDHGLPIYRDGHGLGDDGSGRAGAPLDFPSFMVMKKGAG